MNSNVKTVNGTVIAYVGAMWLACVLVASNAYADGQVRTETVRFADLNVGTPAGAEALYGRIHAAARHVCTQPDPLLQASATTCAKRAEAQAIEKLNLPQLTAYYQMKTGNVPPTFTANR